jgi:hypothetical protein
LTGFKILRGSELSIASPFLAIVKVLGALMLLRGIWELFATTATLDASRPPN